VQHGGTFTPGQAQYADVNGDGRADLIMQGNNNSFYVSLSTGSGFTAPVQWMQHGGSFIAGQAQYADVNGDGKCDLLFQGNDNKEYLSLSTGSSFGAPTVVADFGAYGSFQPGTLHA
jgi:FG-GAP-like repeat